MTDTIKQDLAAMVSRMPRYGKLIYKLYRDSAMSKRQKAILSVGLAYAVSPIDLIPGFIPVAGQLDDIIAALSALVKVLNEIPPEKREVYISEFEFSMEEIEGDLAAAKKAMRFILGKAFNYADKGVKFTGLVALKFAGKGLSLISLGMSHLFKKSFLNK